MSEKENHDEKHQDDGDDGKQQSFDWMPDNCKPLADGEYDVIVMGTSFTNCILSGLLSVEGLKVLVVDRNNYYGGETASLNLTNLFAKFRGEGVTPPEQLGSNRYWNVDLIPKFIMANGNLVKILLHTGVTRYLDFNHIHGSYVFKSGKILKVPATPAEALSSSLMGFFEKRKFRKFLIYVADYKADEPATHKGMDLTRLPMSQLYSHFGLDDNTQSFIGHAMALHRSDEYLNRPALETLERIQLYQFSLLRYGSSPYIYPLYGLGGLPESFSRLCAINNGTFILNNNVDEILYDDDGVAWGIKTGDEVAKGKFLIGDPSYFSSSKIRATGRVARSICILNHPIKNTDNAESVQVIIPARQVGGRYDIYVCMVGKAHEVAAQGYYVAIVSRVVETDNPIQELAPGLQLCEPILERFDNVSETFEPLEDGIADRCFISKSYDAESHFETASRDVLDLYERITGKQLDMSISADLGKEDY